MSRPLKVFLSYAREDAARVETLYKNLAAAGFQPWMDRSDIPEGSDWLKRIRSAIAAADVFLACISIHSVNKSGVLEEEMDAALRLWRTRWWRRLKLIPVRLDETALPARLGHLQWFDFFADDRWRELAPRIRQAQRRYLSLSWAAAALLVLGIVLAGRELARSEADRWPEGPQRFGLTLWTLRESTPEDDVRLRIEPTTRNGLQRAADYTPVRVGLNEPLPGGAMVRIGVESAQDGYLYIVDQERSPAPGRACIVFPDPLIRAGANRVHAGELVDLPPLGASVPPYWLLRGADANYRGELLTVVMSPKPLQYTARAGACMELNLAEFTGWKKEWEASFSTEVDRASIGRPASRGELKTAQGAKILTLDDPRPQIVLSMSGKARNVPVLVSFPLQVDR